MAASPADALRALGDVAETLRMAREREKRCTLLIGAGCSVRAGIPSAPQLVEVIGERYPRAFARAREKSYPACMAELSLGERRDLIAEYVDRAKINWAHIGIAQLMKAGYVDRVLTTNFDPLVVRACAFVGLFPAVYDFAASQAFQPADIPDQAIFYLHGQRTGFVLMNTAADFKQHSKLLAPVFDDAGRGRVWLVVGYSGESDPVFQHLASVPRFDNFLYWVGYRDSPPQAHVTEKLLVPGKDAFFVPRHDADGFFVQLAQRLECFPPEFVASPFSYLGELLDELTPYVDPHGSDSGRDEVSLDVLAEAREVIKMASETIDSDPIRRRIRAAERAFLAGAYDEIIDMRSFYDSHPDPELANHLVQAYRMKAWQLSSTAEEAPETERSDLLAQAEAAARSAVELGPADHYALNTLGNTLAARVRLSACAGRDPLKVLEEARTQIELAIAEGPTTPTSYYNLGCVHVLAGNLDEGKRALERMLEVELDGRETPPSPSHMAKDPDLVSVRDQPWFKEILARLEETHERMRASYQIRLTRAEVQAVRGDDVAEDPEVRRPTDSAES